MTVVFRLFLVAFIFSFIGCDPTWSVLINGQKNPVLPLSSSCRIEISVVNSHVSKYYFTLTPLDSDLTITDFNALLQKIISVSKDLDSYSINDQKEGSIVVAKGESLKFNLNRDIFKNPVSKDKKGTVELIIPPNEYLICNGQQVIRDTIKYELKIGKIRVFR